MEDYLGDSVRREHWRGFNVARTGRVRALTGRQKGNRPPRTMDHSEEYVCLDCGHFGWSRHVDIKRKPILSSNQLAVHRADASR